MWLQAVDNGLVSLEHADQIGGLLFPDEEGAIVRATDDVLSIAGRGAKGREVRWGTALQPQGEAVWLGARKQGSWEPLSPPELWGPHSIQNSHTCGSPFHAAGVTVLLGSAAGTAWVPPGYSPPEYTISLLGASMASFRSANTWAKPVLSSPSLPGSRPQILQYICPSHTVDI